MELAALQRAAIHTHDDAQDLIQTHVCWAVPHDLKVILGKADNLCEGVVGSRKEEHCCNAGVHYIGVLQWAHSFEPPQPRVQLRSSIEYWLPVAVGLVLAVQCGQGIPAPMHTADTRQGRVDCNDDDDSAHNTLTATPILRCPLSTPRARISAQAASTSLVVAGCCRTSCRSKATPRSPLSTAGFKASPVECDMQAKSPST